MISQDEFCHRLWSQGWHRSRVHVREAFKRTGGESLTEVADYLKLPHRIALKENQILSSKRNQGMGHSPKA